MKKTVFMALILFSRIINAGDNVVLVGDVFNDPACQFNSIQDAINAPMFGNKDIRIAEGIYLESLTIQNTDQISLTGGYVDCTAAMNQIRDDGSRSTVDGNGLTAVTINGGETQSLINFTGLNITGGSPMFLTNAGGIHAVDSVFLNLIDSSVVSSFGRFGGGILAGSESIIYVKDTMIQGNQANLGGGVYCLGCTLIVDSNSGVSQNDAVDFNGMSGTGGGIFLGNGSQLSIYAGSRNPQLDNIGIHGNSSSGIGGGIASYGSTIELIGEIAGAFGNSTDPVNISNNTAGTGGGIFADNSAITATSVVLSDNNGGEHGAGINIENSQLTVAESSSSSCWSVDASKCNQFKGNKILNGGNGGGSGGALRAVDSTVMLSNLWFEDNDAGGDSSGEGAAISFIGAEMGTFVENSVFFNNGFVTGDDVSIIENQMSNVVFRHVTLAQNSANLALIQVKGNAADTSTQFQNSVFYENPFSVPVFNFEIQPFPAVTDLNCIVTYETGSFPLGSFENVTSGDPGFVNVGSGNLRLSGESDLAIDICPESASPSPFDLGLNPRIVNILGINNDFGEDHSDAGAFEYQGTDLDLIFADDFE